MKLRAYQKINDKRVQMCQQLCQRAQRAFPDYEFKFGSTSHKDFHHGHIMKHQEGSKTPLSIGRIVFHYGQYSHIKFYGSHDVYLAYALRWMVNYNIVVKPKFWATIWLKACAMADRHYNEKVDARAKLKPKKRPALTRPNPCNFVELPEHYRTIIKGK